jgi:multidrug efflux pump subunit AcrA (membrane-fusion protein)
MSVQTLIIFVLTLSLAACGEHSSKPSASDQNDTLQAAVAIALSHMARSETEMAVDHDAHAGRYIAVIAPVKAIVLAPRFTGELRAIHVQAGDRVEPGQLIAELDARQLREALVVSEAELQSAHSARL